MANTSGGVIIIGVDEMTTLGRSQHLVLRLVTTR